MKKWVVSLGLLVAVAGLGVGGTDAVRAQEPVPDLLEVEIAVSPNTIVLDSEATWVTVHTDIPLGSVAVETLALSGIDVSWVKADAKGNLVAKFDFDAVAAIVSKPSATLTLTGTTVGGVPFEGSDMVRVRE